jgi:RNA polymerase sigma-70 factor (ECF subfamily)
VTISDDRTAAATPALLDALPRLRRFARCLTGTPAAADSLVHAAVALSLACGVDDAATLLCDGFRHCVTLWDGVGAAAGPPQASTDGIRGALAALPTEQRAAFALVAIEGCSYAAAAAILETSVTVVLARLARARAALAECMARDAEPLLARFEVAR